MEFEELVQLAGSVRLRRLNSRKVPGSCSGRGDPLRFSERTGRARSYWCNR